MTDFASRRYSVAPKSSSSSSDSEGPALARRATPGDNCNTNEAKGKGRNDLRYSIAALASGLIFGLSAPGWEQWYIAWFGMAPFLLLVLRSSEPSQAAFRGFLFGCGYNLMYLVWANDVRDVYWVGSLSSFPILLKISTWLILSTWQGLYVAIFAGVVRAIPMNASWLPMRIGTQWQLPSLFFIPLLWCLVIEKLGNMPSLLGVPWSMIQYSQYKQLAVIQCASIFGGIGIAFILVLSNMVLAMVLNHLKPFQFGNWQIASLYSRNRLITAASLTVASLIVITTPIAGSFILAKEANCAGSNNMMRVSAVQSALTSKAHNATPIQIASRYLELGAKSGPGLLVYPEWAFATNASEGGFFKILGPLAKERQQSWIAGVMDERSPGESYNAIVGVNEEGKPLPDIYHKNFLVPFGEYLPAWTRDSVVGQVLFFNETIEQTQSGQSTTVFDLGRHRVGAILCFENLLPELSAKNTRNGANILADCSNTSWFHRSILSDQMVAFSVMRAVENHRSFVFATALGPSTIIDSTGHIVAQAPREQPAAISADVPIETEITPFTRFSF